jgi:hypothetical protein
MIASGGAVAKEMTAAQRAETGETSDSSPVPVNVAPHLSDAEKIDKARDHLRDDQILAASRLLQCVHEDSIPSQAGKAFQQEVQRKAALIQSVMDDLWTHPGEHWKEMGETHSANRDTVMYYQVTEDLQLKCRLETPIESSLLVPLLSVLIETDLYITWLPCWNYPRIGLDKVEKLAQMGRTEQTIQVCYT